MDERDETAWVTGASSGIGEAVARELSRRGRPVVLSGRRTQALERLAAELPGPALALPFEATDQAALPAAVEQAWAWRDGVELLVNNAGVSQRSLALDTDLEVYRRLMEVDFFAPLALTQLVLPRMVARRRGHVANVSSVAGKVGTPLRGAYCAAKHALVGWSDALRAEVEAAYGVKVSTILPGSVRTQVAVNALGADGQARGVSDENIDNGMAPEVAAALIVDALEAGRREILVAEGVELMAARARAADPERLFDLLAQEGARLAALREAQGPAFRPDPARIREA
ncbi:MAG: SDR family NAD(P)-dependent oxidoreductase [Caulobacteraceae bacterium]|nr:SDR family NAD(P)-dependent oxidoreductase [Caulobacter sp.]